MKTAAIYKLLRPVQWVKNTFVYLPLFFSGRLFDVGLLLPATIVFISFSFLASSVYCINDLIDAKADRIHPVKRFRPVANGDVSAKTVIVMAVLLFFVSMTVMILLPERMKSLLTVLCVYFLINMAYSFKLKQIAIVDVFVVAFGFVLRLFAGGIACDIWISPWIVCMTFLLALFLAFAKRRDDVLFYEKSGVAVRKNIVAYNREYLNQTLGIIASVTMVCYIIFSLSPDVMRRMGSSYVFITSIFVLAGILRYLQLALVRGGSGNPTEIFLNDRFLRICIVLWIVTYIIIIYL